MREPLNNPCVHLFGEHLWEDKHLRGRSTEFTPLYLDRLRAPRENPHLYAHDYWELFSVLEGNGALVWKERLSLTVNSVCLIPRNVSHREDSGGVLDTIWLGFRTTRLNHRTLPKPITVQSQALTKFMEQCWIFARQHGGGVGHELDGMTAMAVGWFLRLASAGKEPGEDSVANRVIRYLHDHFTETICLPDLTRLCGCSEGHLLRTFKRQTARTPMQYLTQLRVQHAAHLLEHTALLVADIARQVGYDDPLYFSRVFRKLTARSPRAYRLAGARHALAGGESKHPVDISGVR